MTNCMKAVPVAVFAVVALLFSGGDVLAQGMGGGQHGGHGMGRMKAFSPHHLLMHGNALQLTEGQRESLVSIQRDAMTVHDAAKATHDERKTELLDLFSGEVTGSEARELFGAAHAAGGEAHWSMINAAIESMALLDELQLARAHGWADMMAMMGRARNHGRGVVHGANGDSPHEHDEYDDDDDDDEHEGRMHHGSGS